MYNQNQTYDPNQFYPSDNLQYFDASGYTNQGQNNLMQPSFPSHEAYNVSGTMSSTMEPLNAGGSDLDNEPPLLEELGINFGEIWSKTIAMSIPGRAIPHLAENETDLAGPLLYCLMLGFFLLCTGKFHFGYICGFGFIGCILMYIILNLMSDESISIDRTMSILGYSLLPMVLLALINVLAFLNLFFDLRGLFGFGLSFTVIAWCALNATRCIEKALAMREQRWLIAYPTVLLYACFALLTIY